MSNEQKILNILEAMQGDISAMQGDISVIKSDVGFLKDRVDTIEAKIEVLMENDEEFRENINMLIEWSELAQHTVGIKLIKDEVEAK